jgi:hypothetical protein
MADDDEKDTMRAGVSESQMKETVVRLAFNEDVQRYETFVKALKGAVPDNTGAVLRGSAITGFRWNDGAPFDADGPGTSDLDLTLIGAEVVGMFRLGGFYIPGIHSKPVGEDQPDIAPDLLPLRDLLVRLAGRPVNIQATRDFVMFVREHVMGQPYLTLIAPAEEDEG